jgi:hypothetical protein
MLHYDRLLPNPIIRLRWKGLPGRNTLAYYKHLQITDVKNLLSLAQEVLMNYFSVHVC